MSIKEAYNYAIYRLLDEYDRREADNIAKILFEDSYGIRNFKRVEDFMEKKSLDMALDRLAMSEPIEYITGKSVFLGLPLKINRHVLIPRPETEELVHWILTDFGKDHTQKDVLDIGTGSGCICVTLKKKKPTFRVFGIEDSLDAMNCSRINARKLNVNIEFFRVNILNRALWKVFSGFDIIVSNPPYITEIEKELMSRNVIDYEPAIALFVNNDDPLIFYKTIAEFAKKHLNGEGKIYLEMNEFHAEEIAELFEEKFSSVEVKKDMQGKERMLKVSKE